MTPYPIKLAVCMLVVLGFSSVVRGAVLLALRTGRWLKKRRAFGSRPEESK